MLHKFRVKSSGTEFYFCNDTNALYDKDKRRLSLALQRRDNAQAPNDVPDDGRVVKVNAPREIKIVFGHKCNYSCGYCIQKDLGDHDAEHMSRAEAKSRATLLIENMRKSLDLSRLEQLELWGGEIFLFWPEVQEVLLAFDRPGFDFVFPTNGTLLKEHHIDFFRALQGRVSLEISHDGPAHELMRGPDFLDKKAPVFKYIEQFPDKVRAIINVVLSKNNFDLKMINDYFRDFFARSGVKPLPLFFMPIMVHDTFSRGHSIDASIDQYGRNLSDFLDMQIAQFKRLGAVAHDELLQTQLFHIADDGDDNHGVLQWAAKMRAELDSLDSTICGMHQMDKMVIDISGNIKACQNVGDSAPFNGNIIDFQADPTPKVIRGMNMRNEVEKCKACPVRLQCLGGCPLDVDDASFEVNCKLSTVHNMTKLHAAFKILFNSDVEWLGADVGEE